MRCTAWSCAVVGVVLVGCGSDGAPLAGPSDWALGSSASDGGVGDAASTGGGTDGAAATGDAGSGSALSGLPCDVSALLATYCVSCHGSTPLTGVPFALTSYGALSAASPTLAGKTVAENSLATLQAGTMPPAGAKPSASEIAAFAAWVSAGTPDTGCATDAGIAADPYATPVQCSSGTHWDGREGKSMRPGEACISCHAREEDAPLFAIAGTVYPTAHEPDDCNGSAAGAEIVITDKNGAVVTLPANSVGNFQLEGSLALPYTAVVRAGGRTRSMATPQTSGDCNSCHTNAGTNNAPGRILLP